VSEEGIVTQKNVLTGETYSHPSLEALFHQQSARTRYGGLTWTIKKLGGDTFLLQFVGCPREVAEVFKPLNHFKKETRTEWTFENTRVRKFLGWTWMYTTRNGKEFLLEDVDLYDKLRRYVAGKPRTARMKSELSNYARRLINKADIISIHGGGCHEINVGRLSDYVEAAFYVDARHELEVAMSYARENATVVEILNAYYETGKVPMDLAKVQKALYTGVKVVKSAGTGVAVTAAAAAVASGGTAPVIAGVLAGATAIAGVAAARVVWQEHCEDVGRRGPGW